jgi:crotonobetainyl-CoA:carnitine CoA-transferase CaiB-like acyl-CoA transferase
MSAETVEASNGTPAVHAPLHGIRVLDLSTVVAGPFSSMILADLGAEVIKVERIDGGDDSRAMGPHRGPWGAMFVPLNRGKRSITVDITTPKGREVVLRLAAISDVFIQNFRGGKAAELRLDEASIRECKPDIIYASLSAFGTTGPDFLKPGYDGLIQGRTGIVSITGADADSTARAGVSLIDMSAGMWLVTGILAALYERQRTGHGQRVDTSLLQTGVMLMAYHLLYRQFVGTDPVPQGSGHSSFAPYGAFRTADGQIMIGVSNDRVYRRFCKGIEHPEWATDPRFISNVLRGQNRPELDALIGAELLTRPTAHWTAVFDRHDVPVSAVQTTGEVLKDPQVVATGQLEAIHLPGTEEDTRIPRLPVSLSENPPRIGGPPPRLGEHGYEILKTAGYRDEEIEELLSAKAFAAR